MPRSSGVTGGALRDLGDGHVVVHRRVARAGRRGARRAAACRSPPTTSPASAMVESRATRGAAARRGCARRARCTGTVAARRLRRGRTRRARSRPTRSPACSTSRTGGASLLHDRLDERADERVLRVDGERGGEQPRDRAHGRLEVEWSVRRLGEHGAAPLDLHEAPRRLQQPARGAGPACAARAPRRDARDPPSASSAALRDERVLGRDVGTPVAAEEVDRGHLVAEADLALSAAVRNRRELRRAGARAGPPRDSRRGGASTAASTGTPTSRASSSTRAGVRAEPRARPVGRATSSRCRRRRAGGA